MKKVITIVAIIILVPVLACAGIYLYYANLYKGQYVNGVMINSVYATDMTPEEVNKELVDKLDVQTFIIEDRNGEVYEIPVADMNFTYTYMEELNKILTYQNPMIWLSYLQNGDTAEYTILPKGEVDKDALSEYLLSMELIKDQANPDKARVKIVRTKEGYELIDETKNILDVEKTVSLIEEAVLNGDASINLEEAECYYALEYTKKMEETLALWKKIDKLQSLEIVCTFYDSDEQLSVADIASCIAKDEKGNFKFDEDGKLELDFEGLPDIVHKWAVKHNSAGGPWTFHPTRGGTVTIEQGTYGYKLNEDKEVAWVKEALEKRRNSKTEAIYSQKGWGDSTGDIGSTYIEVDMTAQHLYYYVNGKLKLDTDVVTGCTGNGNGTPERVCYIYFKQRNRVLVGPDYRTPVSYWMAVYNHIGIHDANWRGKFGGEIYKRSGSHGCINTPTKSVAKLYEMAEVGTPVVLFY